MQVFDDRLDDQMRQQELKYLEHAAGMVKAALPGGEVTSALEEGHIATVIKDQVAKSKADLIVMTTHSRGPLARFWLGSVTDELVRDSPVPLLLAHPREGSPSLNQDANLSHWLIPLDGTDLAEHILEPALAIGELLNADFTLLRVIKPVIPVVMPVGIGSFGAVAEDMMGRVETLQDLVKKDSTEYLEKVAAKLRLRNVTVQTQIAMDEQPGEAILNRAKTGISAIALGTHGRHGLSRLFMGSVADNVIRGANVPVLVHHPKV